MAERRYGFRFSLPEGCVIVLSLLLCSFLVFLFGVYVGKEVEARKVAEQTRTVRLPVSAAEEPTHARPLAGAPSLLWKLPTEKLAVPPPAPTPGASPPAQKPSVSPLSSTPAHAAPQTSVLRPVSAPVGKKPAAPAGRWSVQVQTTTQQEVAQNVARLLREQGHTPLVNKVVRQGEVWYRVRVGTFTNQEEARAAAARFRREGKFAQAYLVSE